MHQQLAVRSQGPPSGGCCSSHDDDNGSGLDPVHAEGTSSLSADVGPAAPAAPAAAATAASVLHTVVATTAARTQCDNIPVVCGKLVGLMLLPSKRIVVDAGTPQAREVSPTEFERLGGRGSRKRWRRTVFVIDGGWWS